MVVVVAEQLVCHWTTVLSVNGWLHSECVLCWHNCMIIDEEHNSYVIQYSNSIVSCLSETMIRARVGSSLLLLKFLFKNKHHDSIT